MGERQELAGWGGTPRSAATVVALSTPVGDSTVIARGLGRSYGDAAQNAGGTVVVTTGRRSVELDTERGLLRAEAGASIGQIHELTVPAGWFLPVIPGTRFVTVGGAIAADIHGKNHHRSGSFGQHVRSMRLSLGTGEIVGVDPESDPDLFWATVGGMGLTGTVLEAEIQLTPIESSELIVDSRRTADLDATMAALESADQSLPYTVAWIDATAPPSSNGRGIVEGGRFATAEESSELSFSPHRQLGAPPLPAGAIALGARALNRGWYRVGALRRSRATRSIGSFFHPLDAVDRWNRAYGATGFVQWQMVVPAGAEATLAHCIGSFAAARAPAVLAVLKRFGPAGSGHLSFPLEGWTLSVDLPADRPDVAMLLDRLDRVVVDAGGRVYLAKDSRVDPELVPPMYPRLTEWRQIRERADPRRRMRSDLARRLGL